MDTESELMQKRLEVKQEILALKEQVLSARILDRLGRAFKRNSFGYWLSNLVLLHCILFSPVLFGVLTLEETEKFMPVLKGGTLATEGSIFIFFIAHLAVRGILNDIANRIAEKISNIEDLSTMLLWVEQSWSTQSISTVVLPYCLLWVVVSIISNSILIHQFVGVSFSLWFVLVGLFAGIVVHTFLWTCLLVTSLKKYQYDMNAFSPADSEIINDISEMMAKPIYMLAGASAVITLVITSSLVDHETRAIFGIPVLAIGWALILAQFLLTRSTLSTVTNRAKWATLNRIRTKINNLEATGDLSDKDTAERLFRLADIHKQIMSSKSNTLDLKSVSTLISQLMLPILGLLLGNIDKVLDLLR